MSWTRLDDLWTERADIGELTHATRWHLLAMIQRCSRSDLRNGILRTVDARRCSDHPDPAAALAELMAAGLIERTSDTAVRVVGIDAYLPSDATRQRTENNRLYQQRSRAHRAGNHRLCLPDKCPDAVVSAPVSADVSMQVSDDVGTGRDGTPSLPSLDGRDKGRAQSDEQSSAPAAASRPPLPPSPDETEEPLWSADAGWSHEPVVPSAEGVQPWPTTS